MGQILVKRPYIKIIYPSLHEGWYGSYDSSCVVSRIPGGFEEKHYGPWDGKIYLYDDTFFIGLISKEELFRINKIQQEVTFEKFLINFNEYSAIKKAKP